MPDEKAYLKIIDDLKARLRESEALIEDLRRQIRDGVFLDKEEIMSAYKFTEYKLKKYVKKGMPVRIEDGSWTAHRDNINAYFKASTMVNSSNAKLDGE